MDDEYILAHLKKWIPLFYGNGKKEIAYFDPIENVYIFGIKGKLNLVTKPVAIFLSLGAFHFLKFLEKERINPETLESIKTKRIRSK